MTASTSVRNAAGYYRADVAVEKATHAALAREYLATRRAAGVFLEPDTRVVRDGIADAKRLLEPPIPPEQWAAYAKFSA